MIKPEQTILLRGLSPAALKIFLVLLWNGAPMGSGDLSVHTGYDAEAIRDGLKLLEALGMAHNTRRYNGWTLTLQGRQLVLPVLAALETGPERERGFSSLAGESRLESRLRS